MSSPFLVVNAFLYYNRSMQKHTILASQSPRRRELLNLMGISFTTVNPNVDEVINPNLSLENAIEELAYQGIRCFKSSSRGNYYFSGYNRRM